MAIAPSLSGIEAIAKSQSLHASTGQHHHRRVMYSHFFYPWTEHLHASSNATLIAPLAQAKMLSAAILTKTCQTVCSGFHSQTYCWALLKHWYAYYRARTSQHALRHVLLNVAFSPTGHTGVGQLLIGARSLSVSIWQENKSPAFSRPLRAWYTHSRKVRSCRRAQNRLVTAHVCARNR